MQKSHQRWAVAALTGAKNEFKFPNDWGNGALHHQISKFYLEALGLELKALLANKNADKDVQTAAKNFWGTVQKAVPKELREQAKQDFVTILWNMPLNLEIGPEDVVNNPGIGFDPNTELKGNERKLTSVSQHLQVLERTYLRARRQGPLTAKDWNDMNSRLASASQAFQIKLRETNCTLLPPPDIDQWVRDRDETGEVRYQRKGLKLFLGEKEGSTYFTRALDAISPKDLEDLTNLKDSEDVIRTLKLDKAATLDGKPVPLVVTFLENTLYHICVRHTYRYFDFAQAKVVNSFWPDSFLSVADVQQRVIKALPAIGQAGCDFLQEEANTSSDLRALDTYLTGHNIRIDNDSDETVYFIANIGYGELDTGGECFELQIKTATQDAGTHAYTRDQLSTIAKDAKVKDLLAKRQI